MLADWERFGKARLLDQTIRNRHKRRRAMAIVSHRYKFIFVKTRKTAGTSIELYLSGLCGARDRLTPLVPAETGHQARNHDGMFNHMSARALAALEPDCWRRYFTFCVERNPWDKMLSWHAMKRRSPDHGARADLTLDDCLAAHDRPLNHPLYCDGAGAIMVDAVLRYESLDAELARVFDQIGVPFPGVLPVRAKSHWRTDRRPYREVYTSAQAECVGALFAREIELHGYEF